MPEIINEKNFDSLIKRIGNIKTVDDFQNLMSLLLKNNLQNTTDSLSYSGQENLQENGGNLFISNHRSTSLDAAYLNYILNYMKLATMYSGAGDNIFETEWLGDLIRLNKGFIIKRNVEEVDDKIVEANRLSHYINDLLKAGNSVWISQQPGRAKDGIDKTDSVIITMLNKFNGETKNYNDWLNTIYLIPLCISWEIIPCDFLMAQEIVGERDKKVLFVDRKNILHEITSHKGMVHYHFCNRVRGDKRSEIVNSIDIEITSNYRLWGTNWLAYLKTEKVSPDDEKLINKYFDLDRAEKLLKNGKTLSLKAQKAYLEMYANSVKSALKHKNSINELIEENKLKELKQNYLSFRT